MKKVLSMALVLGLMLGTVSVQAENAGTDLVPLYDFESLNVGAMNDDTLKSLGITADTDGKSEISVVDLSKDKEYGGLGKVLHWKSTFNGQEGVQEASLRFPLNYQLNDEEKLVIEYDMLVSGEPKTMNDTFMSKKWGYTGVLPSSIEQGGVGVMFQIFDRSKEFNAYRNGMGLWKNNAGTPEVYNRAIHVKEVVDVEKYKKDSTKGLTITTDKPISHKDIMGTVREKEFPIREEVVTNPLSDLVFNNTSGAGEMYLDNIHVYKIEKLKYTASSISDGETGVFYDTKEVTFDFTKDIKDASAVTVALNGASFSDYDVNVTGKTVKILFKNNLEYSGEYVIDLSGVIDVTGQKPSNNAKVSFTVEAMPEIKVLQLQPTMNIGKEYGNTDSFDALKGLQGVSLEIENTTTENKNVTVIFAVYQKEGNLLREMTVTETAVPASQIKKIETGLNLGSYSGGKVQAFIWDSMSSLMPWQQSNSFVIK